MRGRERDFVFLTDLYATRWSSINFYALMMGEIRRTIEAAGYATRSLATLDVDDLDASSVLLIDNAAVVSLARHEMLEQVVDTRHVLIIGENIDFVARTFVGWTVAPYLAALRIDPPNILCDLVTSAERVTWQNRPVRDWLSSLVPADRMAFFPLDGFRETERPPAPDVEKDIDVLVYGGMVYERRARFVAELLRQSADMRIAILSNVFALDDMLDRAKVVLHVNSVDGCTHVPYAKIMKPLARGKIMFVEGTEELGSSDLRPYLRVFRVDAVQELVRSLRGVIDRFPEEQERLHASDLGRILRERYDFRSNVHRLLEL